MGNVCVSMDMVGRAKDVVDRACHMKYIAMENVSAGMDTKQAIDSVSNVVNVNFNASQMRNIAMDNVSASMELIKEQADARIWQDCASKMDTSNNVEEALLNTGRIKTYRTIV